MESVTVPDFLPKCSDSLNSSTACYTPYYSKGYVVHDSYSECMDSWVLFPGFNLLPNEFQAFIYFLVLIYAFFGVAIVSDVFMASIDVITEKEKVIRRKDVASGEVIEFSVKFWNPTVANLTLMALGSSAPEIMLALIEAILSLDQEPGKLGPSTIVGSAAFNLLAITSVCVMSIPTGEYRSIDELPVFVCTAFFSLLAYIWLYLVYSVWTPDEITVIEAVITFLFFPLMVYLAYYLSITDLFSSEEAEEDAIEAIANSKGADGDVSKEKANRNLTIEKVEDVLSGGAPEKGVEGGKKRRPSGTGGKARIERVSLIAADGTSAITADKEKIIQLLKNDKQGSDITLSDYYGEQAKENKQKWSKIKFRMNAVRAMSGQNHVVMQKKPKAAMGTKVMPVLDENSPTTGEVKKPAPVKRRSMWEKNTTYETPAFMFSSSSYAVRETEGILKVVIHRAGPENEAVAVEYYTEDGTAEGNTDYIPVSGILNFKEGQKDAEVEVPIVDDGIPEPDENFYVCLRNPSPTNCLIIQDRVEVTIIDDDQPGMLAYRNPYVSTTEVADEIEVEVIRKKGSSGMVSVDYVTEDGDASAHTHYKPTQGTLVFKEYEIKKSFVVHLLNLTQLDEKKKFKVRLSNVTGGAQLSKRDYATIEVRPDTRVDEIAKRIARLMKEQDTVLHKKWTNREWVGAWKAQFVDAVIPAGTLYINEDGQEEPPSVVEAVMHYIAITWKVIFAFIPPVSLNGGWVTFYVSLLFIGMVTAVVAEFASLFGCMVGLKDEMTAISIVALGTSLPDTFASRQAAVECDNADAAIGNVTGSNSVNVFLGLGLPWLLASLYYSSKGEKYMVVGADKVGFSVALFSICAIIAIGTLFASRLKRFGGGELGGTYKQKLVKTTLFASLWLIYLLGSGLYIYEII